MPSDDLDPRQPCPVGRAVIKEALELHSRYPAVPALEVLDVVMKDRRGIELVFGDLVNDPDDPFVLLVTEAFDHLMPDHLRRWLKAEPTDDIRSDDTIGEAWELWPWACLASFSERYQLNEHKPWTHQTWRAEFLGGLLAEGPVYPEIAYAELAEQATLLHEKEGALPMLPRFRGMEYARKLADAGFRQHVAELLRD